MPRRADRDVLDAELRGDLENPCCGWVSRLHVFDRDPPCLQVLASSHHRVGPIGAPEFVRGVGRAVGDEPPLRPGGPLVAGQGKGDAGHGVTPQGRVGRPPRR